MSKFVTSESWETTDVDTLGLGEPKEELPVRLPASSQGLETPKPDELGGTQPAVPGR